MAWEKPGWWSNRMVLNTPVNKDLVDTKPKEVKKCSNYGWLVWCTLAEVEKALAEKNKKK